jgi:hypothetical protein
MSPLDGQITAPDAPPDGGTPPLADAYLRHRAWLTAVLTGATAATRPPTSPRTPGCGFIAMCRRPRSSPQGDADAHRFEPGLQSHAQGLPPTVTDPRSRGVLEPVDAGGQEQTIFFEQMMLALPPKLRDVFALTHIERQNLREIASCAAFRSRAVEKRMRQAMRKCADFLRKLGGSRHDR